LPQRDADINVATFPVHPLREIARRLQIEDGELFGGPQVIARLGIGDLEPGVGIGITKSGSNNA